MGFLSNTNRSTTHGGGICTGTLDNVPAPGTITVVYDSSGQLNPGDSITYADAIPNTYMAGDLVSFDIDNSGRVPVAINLFETIILSDGYRNKNGFN